MHCESLVIHIPLSPRAVFLQRRSSELMDNEELTVSFQLVDLFRV